MIDIAGREDSCCRSVEANRKSPGAPGDCGTAMRSGTDPMPESANAVASDIRQRVRRDRTTTSLPRTGQACLQPHNKKPRPKPGFFLLRYQGKDRAANRPILAADLSCWCP